MTNDLISRSALLAAFLHVDQCTAKDSIEELIADSPAVVPVVVANITGGILQGASATHNVDLYTLDFDEGGAELDGDVVGISSVGCDVDPDFAASAEFAYELANEDDPQ